MKYYIYILKSLKFDKFYTGYTNDLKRRLNEHNSGKSEYTRKFKPWKIDYFEECNDVEEARQKEKYYKSASGRRKIRKILNNFNCPGSSAG
ncbi:MAG: GIY-YIG nuclease family protein [Ignavibacterium sp.]